MQQPTLLQSDHVNPNNNNNNILFVHKIVHSKCREVEQSKNQCNKLRYIIIKGFTLYISY